MNYSDIVAIVTTLEKRYYELEKELKEHEENAIQDHGGYEVYNNMTNEERDTFVYNDKWRSIIDERHAVREALDHFKTYSF